MQVLVEPNITRYDLVRPRHGRTSTYRVVCDGQYLGVQPTLTAARARRAEWRRANPTIARARGTFHTAPSGRIQVYIYVPTRPHNRYLGTFDTDGDARAAARKALAR